MKVQIPITIGTIPLRNVPSSGIDLSQDLPQLPDHNLPGYSSNEIGIRLDSAAARPSAPVFEDLRKLFKEFVTQKLCTTVL